MNTERETCLKEKKAESCDDKQIRKFKSVAKELGCDESENALDVSFARIVKPVKPKKKSPQKSK